MDKQLFYKEIGQSLFNGRLSPAQRDGMEVKLEAFDRHGITDKRWRAYMLATSYHETARTMQPIEEFGKGKGRPYGQKRKCDGTPYTHPDKLYYGRGDVQLTWYENYYRMGKLMGIPLLTCPELALDPDISASIMVEGMTRGNSNRGDFTGVSLEDFFNDRVDDPVKARKIVNGLDQAQRIAGFYQKFLAALQIVMVVVLLMMVGCKPHQVVAERIVTRTDSTAMRELTDSLLWQERETSFLQTDVNRAREEIIHLGSVTHQHRIEYDTTLPADSATGRPPVASEVITTTHSRLEKMIEDEETGHGERSGVRESIARERRHWTLTVEKQAHEEKVRLEKTSTLLRKPSLLWATAVVCIALLVFTVRFFWRKKV